MTEAIADATPSPAVPYANKQIGIPMLPVLGKISGGSSLIKSFFNNNKNKIPIIEKPLIIISAYIKYWIKTAKVTPVVVIV